ncbi:DinB family protein [Deinococcus sp.]|uniref:DinB family protein n=1 Tax=Deinococcus sp. TaxID=47478 RepID=UPI003B5C538B
MTSALRTVIAEALPRLQAITKERASLKPAPEVWSAKQVLGHLTDSGINNYARLLRLSLEDELDLPGYAQNEWVRLGGYGERTWADAVALWTVFQLQMAQLIDNLPPKSRSHTARIGGGEAVTLAFLAEDYVAHQLHHLAQIWERAE